MVRMGAYSINDVLRLEDLNPIAGGDEHIVDMNRKPIGAPDPEPTPDPGASRMIEHKHLPFAWKAAGDASGTFTGYGSVFDTVDSYGDTIVKGAFADTLKAWKAKGKLPKQLLQHGGGGSSAAAPTTWCRSASGKR